MPGNGSKKTTRYCEDAMTQKVCLICGEHLGDCMYRGKFVCMECLKYIRANY